MSTEDLPPRTGGKRPGAARGETADRAKGKEGPSLGRRIVSWIFILILLGIVFFEWRARSNYDRSLSATRTRFEEVDKANKEATVTELEGLMTGNPVQSSVTSGGVTANEYRWRSLFRKYVIYIVPDETSEKVMNLTTQLGE